MSSLSNSLRRARPLLGTIVGIRACGAPPGVLENGAAAAFEAIGRVQRLMSYHAPDSELTLLNRRAASRAVQVHEWTWRVLRAAMSLWEESGGLFDCTVAPILAAAGFLPDAHRPAAASRGASMGEVEFLPDRRVRFGRPLLLDLGGIAKGFAVDRAVQALRAAGVPQGVINAGGDLRLFGAEPEPIHVRHPQSPGELLCLGRFADTAVATSAGYFAGRLFGGRQITPIVHPARGEPIESSLSATVIAPECVYADALTKPVLLAGKASAAFLARYSARAVVLG